MHFVRRHLCHFFFVCVCVHCSFSLSPPPLSLPLFFLSLFVWWLYYHTANVMLPSDENKKWMLELRVRALSSPRLSRVVHGSHLTCVFSSSGTVNQERPLRALYPECWPSWASDIQYKILEGRLSSSPRYITCGPWLPSLPLPVCWPGLIFTFEEPKPWSPGGDEGRKVLGSLYIYPEMYTVLYTAPLHLI